MLINKKKGFTILEVLFAIVILTFALSMIFILLNTMFKTVGRVKQLSVLMDKTPLVYSSSSPLIHNKNIENYKSDFFTIPQYSQMHNYHEGDCANLSTIFIASLSDDKDILNTQYFSNIIFMTLQKKNKGEKIENE